MKNNKIVFPDVNLETAIRKELNKPTGDITKTDMESLTSVDFNDFKDIKEGAI